MRAHANSKRQQGSRRPVEALRGEAGKYLGANVEPLSPAEHDNGGDQDDWRNRYEKRVEGTAGAYHATAAETVMRRSVDTAVTMMMVTGIRQVGSVISRMVLGGGGDAGRAMTFFQGNDAGELSGHEQADQNRNDSTKGPNTGRFPGCPEQV